jgi:hypothetical protein
MINLALQAAEAMRDSPIASKLKANGFNPALMQKEAEALSELHTQYVAARNEAVQVALKLSERAEAFATKYASYSNLVRALTTDAGLRRKHGVKSLGARKGPMFRRPRGKAAATGAEAPSTTSTPSTSGESPPKESTNGVTTSVVGHA